MVKCPKCETELNEQKLCPACDNDKVPPNLPPYMNSQESNSYGSNSSFGRIDRFNPTAPTEQDYIDFIGPNASTYLRKFAKYKKNHVETYAFTWHWPVFFVDFLWFLYRKQYIWFIVALASFFFSPSIILDLVIFPLVANYIYYRNVTKKIKQLKASNPNYTKSDLAKLGGTHGWVPWVAIVVFIGIFLIYIAAIIVLLIGEWPDWLPVPQHLLEFYNHKPINP
jgi:hypothetical protein